MPPGYAYVFEVKIPSNPVRKENENMAHVKIADGLYLSSLNIPVGEPKNVRNPVNNILVIDRSGSMYGTLSGLVEDLKGVVRGLRTGDTVTVGWFSSEGQWDWALKGFRITGDQDYSILEKSLDSMKSTLGTTCFSEIFSDVENVVKDLSVFSDSFSLHLMTDGYPVVSNYQKEIAAIMRAVDSIHGKVGSSLIVGYGYYYNKELLAQVAERAGGSLIHSSDLSTYKGSLSVFLESASGRPKRKIDVGDSADGDLVFWVNGSFVQSSLIGKDGTALIDPAVSSAYVLGKNPIGEDGAVEDSAVYAASLLLSQKAKADLALECLGKVGDKALIDDLFNAFSHEEYARTELRLLSAAIDPADRFKAGKVSKYLPKADAFCLLDLLDLLDQAHFHPTHPSFQYRRIGQKMDKKNGYPDFKASPDAKVPVSAFTWHESKLNLSLLAKVPGKVELLDKEIDGKLVSPEDVGISRVYPVSIWRNYTLVKDGNLNVQVLPVSVPESTFQALKDRDLLFGTWEEGKVYELRLDRLPIVNRSIANGRTSAKVLAEKVVEMEKLKASIKALKWLKDQEFPDDKAEAESVGASVRKALLEANGVDPVRDTFSPPSQAVKTDDFYMAKAFDIKVAGLSSLPKLPDVLAKYEGLKKGTKAPTLSEKLVYAGVQSYRSAGLENMPDSVRKEWLNATLAKLNSELRTVRKYVQETKFAVILGKKWFDEFSTREGCTLDVGEFRVSFKLAEEKVAF